MIQPRIFMRTLQRGRLMNAFLVVIVAQFVRDGVRYRLLTT